MGDFQVCVCVSAWGVCGVLNRCGVCVCGAGVVCRGTRAQVVAILTQRIGEPESPELIIGELS